MIMEESIPLAAAIIATGRLARPIIDSGVEFIRNLLGEPTKLTGQLLSDQIRGWQWENRVLIAAKAAEICKRSPQTKLVPPPDFVLPFLEAAGNVCNPDLQSLWAELLASAHHKEAAQKPIFISLLRQMSVADAKFLKENLHRLKSDKGMPGDTDTGDVTALHALVIIGIHCPGNYLGLTNVGKQLAELVMPE